MDIYKNNERQAYPQIAVAIDPHTGDSKLIKTKFMSSTSWKQKQTNELPLITISDPPHSHFFHSHSHLCVILYSSRLSLI